MKSLLTGKALLEEIRLEDTTQNTALWWLGQSGFAVKSGHTLIFIDLYLSEHLTEKYKDAPNPHIRMTQAPFRGTDIICADYFLSSHKHTDHMDLDTMVPAMKNCPNAYYILPPTHISYVSENGVPRDRLISAVTEQPIACGDITIIPIPACHETLDYSEAYGYPHVSYIIKTKNRVLYHSGDTIPYPGLVGFLTHYGVQTALLPINGRDKRRHKYGTPGNCTGEEALCLCRLSGIYQMVPHHYDMFTFNTTDIQEFAQKAYELYPGISCHILSCGEKFIL